MAKNHQTENPLFKALIKQYESDIASAYATLTIYFDSRCRYRRTSSTPRRNG